jgi:hypothetical protein
MRPFQGQHQKSSAKFQQEFGLTKMSRSFGPPTLYHSGNVGFENRRRRSGVLWFMMGSMANSSPIIIIFQYCEDTSDLYSMLQEPQSRLLLVR